MAKGTAALSFLTSVGYHETNHSAENGEAGHMRARRSGAQRRRMAHVLVDRFGPAVWHAVIERMGRTPEAEDAFIERMLDVWNRLGRHADWARIREQVARSLAAAGFSASVETAAGEAVPESLEMSESGDEALQETGLPEEPLPDLPGGLRNRALQRLRAQIAYEEAEARRLGSRSARVSALGLAAAGLALVGYGWWGDETQKADQSANARRASSQPISSGELPVKVQGVFDITRQSVDLGHLAFGGGELVTGSLSLGAQGDGIQLSAYPLEGLNFLTRPRWTSNIAISAPQPEGGSSWLLRSWSLSSAGSWAVIAVYWTESGIHGTASEADIYAVPFSGGTSSLLARVDAGQSGEVVIATGAGGIAWQVESERAGERVTSPVHWAPIVALAGRASLGPTVSLDVNGLIRNPHLTTAGLLCQGTSADPAPAGTWVCIAPTGQEIVYEGVPGDTDGAVVEGEEGAVYALAPVSVSGGETLEMSALHAAGDRAPAFRLDVPVAAWGADGGYVDYVENAGGRTYLVVARAE
ncbi:hypothetical protein [Alicyclobacillus fructus]|uniref:hypothetical protein n=1 Tax=Alicyclobacillus fructus TaxID=2816082 RepID=UPI001F27182D|nr:hypothetical protein [Alicyclobacillus fructus]